MVQQKNYKKRSISETETDKKVPVEQGTLNIVSKKKKTENGSVQNGQGNKQVKMEVPKKFKNEKKTVTVQNPKKQDTNAVGQEKSKTPVVNNDQKKLKLLEKRQEYREKRKSDRIGNPRGLIVDLSVEEIKKKIQQIESRGKITKSAKRKLASLKKKLRIEEGTDKPVVKKEAGKSKKEKSVAVPKKNEVQNNEQRKKVQEKVETKLIKKENKKKQSIVSLPKAKKEVQEEEDEDEEEDVTEDESESDVDLEGEEEEDDDDDDDVEAEEDDEDEDEDDDDDDDDDDDIEGEEEEDVKTKIEHNKDSKVKVSNVQGPKEKGKPKNNEDESKKKRYVLFVGNLPYTITNEELKKHFLTKVGHVVDVRIPKKDANTARGFAYVELGNNVDYEKALSLHHSFVSGRRINVQYSGNDKKAGVAKNFKLHALKNAGKLAGGKKGFNPKFGGNKGRQNARTTKT